MVKEVKLKVKTEADTTGAKDLKRLLDEIKKDSNIKLKMDANSTDIKQLEAELENLNIRARDIHSQLAKLKVDPEVNADEIEALETELQQIKDAKLKITTYIDEAQVQELRAKAGQSIETHLDVDDSEITNAEQKIDQLDNEEVDIPVTADDGELDGTGQKIDDLDNEEVDVPVATDDSEVDSTAQKVDDLDNKDVTIPVNTDDSAVDSTKTKIDGLNDNEVEVNLRNQSAMEAIDQISQGFDRLKQGASEVGQQMGTLLESAGKQEMNRSFLSLNMSAEQVDQTMKDINQTVQDLPGDDTALQGLLSQASVKNANMTADAMKELGTVATDYFSAMSFYGKSSIEAQQDMTNYILAGNTAELERSPILQGHIDKLKEATTVEDRIKALKEAMNEEGWAGISQQDTYNNKLETFNGMIERGRYNLGGMFAEGAKGALDFALKLDDASGGLVGMGLALAGFASPAFDMAMGLAQIATGLNSLKALGIIGWFRELSIVTKLSAFSQMILNSAIWSNPITWLVIAIVALIAVLTYLYFNNEQVRNAINNLGNTLKWVAGVIYSSVVGAFNWLKGIFEDFTSSLGLNTSDWKQAILGFILFLPQLPLRVGQLLVDTIAKALGFGDNFTQTMWDTATNTVNGFGERLQELWGIVQSVFQSICDYVLSVGGLLDTNIDITGNGMIDTILRVIAFVETLPMQIGMIFINIIASALGFGDNFAQTMITGAFNSVNGFVQYISQLPSRAGNYLNSLISKALSFASTFVNNLKTGATNAVNGFIDQIKSLPSKLQAEFDAMLAMARDFVMQIANILTGGGAGMVVGWMTGSGEHSPGFMYDALQGELTAMVGLPMEILSSLIGNISAIGMEMATALSEALFGINFDSVTQSIDWLMTTLMGLWDYITQLVALVPVTIQTLAMQVIASLQGILISLSVLPSQIMAYLNQVLTNASNFASKFISNLLKAGTDASNQFINAIKGLAGKLQSELQNMLSVVDQWASTLPAKFWEAGVNAVKNFLSALGIKSPGIMQRTMAWEVTEMGKNVPNHGRNLISNIGTLGEDVVDAFGKPTLKIDYGEKGRFEFGNANVSGNTTPVHQTINLEIGSVDNEDRINEIIEIIQRELHWNNLTAGRTVDTS